MKVRKQSLSFVIGLALIVGACSTDSSTTPNVAADPTSLSDIRGVGGTYADLTTSEIASISDVGVIVEVLDVKKTRLNTKHGEFPSAGEIIDKGDNGLLSLEAITDVDVQLVETI